jgi:acyl-CoA dehydrogenase
VAQALAGGCTSTAMVWAMHMQQVAVLVNHAPSSWRDDALREVATTGGLVASVTSERGKGGHLLSAVAPLKPEGDGVVVDRHAPVVTAGLRASSFLITMRANEAAPQNQVVLVFARRDQLTVETEGEWDTMGMRGTESVALHLHGRVPVSQVFEANAFRRLALATMIPVGHLAWTAVWLGAARRALADMLEVFRSPKGRVDIDIGSDLFATRLAPIRVRIELADAYLARVLAEYEALGAGGERSDYSRYADTPVQLHVNTLKVVVSDLVYEAIDALIELSGLRHGYARGAAVPLERTLRDLRAASLMYSNERLLIAIGRLSLFDRDVVT